MKQLVYIIGAVSTSLSVLGLLFTRMHWPGGAPLYVFGFGLFALVFVPLLAKYLYDKDKK